MCTKADVSAPQQRGVRVVRAAGKFCYRFCFLFIYFFIFIPPAMLTDWPSFIKFHVLAAFVCRYSRLLLPLNTLEGETWRQVNVFHSFLFIPLFHSKSRDFCRTQTGSGRFLFLHPAVREQLKCSFRLLLLTTEQMLCSFTADSSVWALGALLVVANLACTSWPQTKMWSGPQTSGAVSF